MLFGNSHFKEKKILYSNKRESNVTYCNKNQQQSEFNYIFSPESSFYIKVLLRLLFCWLKY